MNNKLLTLISTFNEGNISDERKAILLPFITFLSDKIDSKDRINLIFICTHNSRRSHLSQVWAQTMSHHFKVQNVFCYSGGTEATGVFYKVIETLENQGFDIIYLSKDSNPVVSVKDSSEAFPSICFSKAYDHPFNPSKNFAAIMTCDSADQNCPLVIGAIARIPIKYIDPKQYDDTPTMDEAYLNKSIEIAQEMWYVFYSITNNHQNKI